MSDQPNPAFEIAGQVTPARLSDDGIAYQQGLLADAKFCEDFPAQAELLRRTLTEALSATGQDQHPAADERTPAQRVHDRRLGVEARQPSDFTVDLPKGYEAPEGKSGADAILETKALLAALQVDPVLGGAIAHDLLSSKGTDPLVIAAQLDRAGIKYNEALANAAFALEHAAKNMGKPVSLKPTDLPAYSLAQLHHWAERLRLHAKTRQ
jgi:hypothetical protein